MSEQIKLPIDDVLPDIISHLKSTGRVVIKAPTGAGKTTRVPPAILDSGLAGTGQIILLEPRRVAARAAAGRMAHERRTKLGTEIGYQVRFDSRVSPQSRIVVMTEGILLRKLQHDPFLEGISAVVFDEFHERNLNSDLALGMIKRIQQEIRPDLKIVVMSATLEPTPIANYLNNAPAVESLGRTYPVDILYWKHRDRRTPLELAAPGVAEVIQKTTGHILVFLPGVGEIHRTARELEPLARQHSAKILTLYGDMSPEDQDAVLVPSEQRKIVLATNVAETSVTIDGVTAVVDTGVARVMRYDPLVGLDRLDLEAISQASADQRSGRAGRTSAGICLRLWEENSHRHRSTQTDPEIRRVDLTGPVLQLKSWGEADAMQFPWFEAPRVDAVQQAELLLQRLDATDKDGRLTALGQHLAQLPTHPRLARLLVAAHEFGEDFRGAGICALLEERDPFMRPRPGPSGRGSALTTKSTTNSESDLLDRLQAFEEYEQTGNVEFPWGTLHRGSAAHLARVRQQLLSDLQSLKLPPAAEHHADLTVSECLLKSLLAAFPDRVAKRRSAGSDKGVMVGGKGVKLAPQSSVRTGEFFLCSDVDAGTTDAVVRQASLIEPDWLPENSCRTVTELFFHPSQRQVVARKREYFLDLLLTESPTSITDEDAAAKLLFQEAAKNWDHVFPKENLALNNFIARLTFLKSALPELELPDISDEFQKDVLRNLCHKARSFADLKKADWLSEMQLELSWPQRQMLDREAPEAFVVPSGSSIMIDYTTGTTPILSVRIQEVFGLLETPRIAGGRVKILMHLLAPNYRPQQVTDDLSSFWANTYGVVRKELARRYPKHPWPEDPLSAKAIRK